LILDHYDIFVTTVEDAVHGSLTVDRRFWTDNGRDSDRLWVQNCPVERLVPEPEARETNGRSGVTWQLRIPAPQARERSVSAAARSAVRCMLLLDAIDLYHARTAVVDVDHAYPPQIIPQSD
jgi:hypothetical protein